MGWGASRLGAEAEADLRCLARQPSRVPEASGSCHAAARRRCAVSSQGARGSRDREHLRPWLRAAGLSAGALLVAGQPRASHRRGTRSRNARPRDDGHRFTARTSREPCHGAEWSGSCRPLPRESPADAEAGPERSTLRPSQCAPPRWEVEGRSFAPRSSRSSIFGALVRWMEAQGIGRGPPAAARDTEKAARGKGQDLALTGRLATPWLD